MTKDTGEIIEITKVQDEFLNITYQIAVTFTEKPEFKLGIVKLVQD
jgi:hypothetical protein